MNLSTRLLAACVAVTFSVLLATSSDAGQHWAARGGANVHRVAAGGLLPYQYGSRFPGIYPYIGGYYGYGSWYPPIDYHYYLDYYRIPYYAKHPPVYYSYPVARPYGYSPYAYPPGTKTPEVTPSEPLTSRNEYIPQWRSIPSKGQVTVLPLRQRNPYVTAPGLITLPEDGFVAADPHDG